MITRFTLLSEAVCRYGKYGIQVESTVLLRLVSELRLTRGFVWRCDFEVDFCGALLLGAWQRGSATPTQGTGPSIDEGGARGTGERLYVFVQRKSCIIFIFCVFCWNIMAEIFPTV